MSSFRALKALLLALCLGLGPSYAMAQDNALSDEAPPDDEPDTASKKPEVKKEQTSPPPSQPGMDPFSRLKIVTPKEKLPPLSSVRVRDEKEQQDRSRKGEISVKIGTTPKGAAVTYGGRSLGTTPISLSAHRGSTPFDVVITASGYMTLHTRIMRRTSHSYFFKLTPAKFR
jgi:hypothetical protein